MINFDSDRYRYSWINFDGSHEYIEQVVDIQKDQDSREIFMTVKKTTIIRVKSLWEVITFKSPTLITEVKEKVYQYVGPNVWKVLPDRKGILYSPVNSQLENWYQNWTYDSAVERLKSVRK